ncbi:MAG: DUF3429 domain-containing protein [Candidatus Puniceispirillaceae bacterium]|jgi:hypothetical protein
MNTHTTPPPDGPEDANREDIAPPLASLMGFGGLIPFFVCAGAAHSGVAPWAGLALIICGVYGAVILSFIGAVHWGLAMQADRSQRWFIWSVVPALCAWPPIVFLDTRTALLALVPGFLLCWSVDRHAAEAGLIPAWYMRLRHMLTLGASMGLAAASLAPPPFPHG